MKTSLVLLIASVGQVLANGWDYAANSKSGPANWPEHYPDCGGSEQSPINLLTQGKESMSNSALPLFSFTDTYTTSVAGKWTNNGHTVMFTPDDSSNLKMTGGSYGQNVYQFLQMHLHWGCTNKFGAEHTINGATFPMEMHLVHWNTKYGNSSAATSQRDGLGVVGIFFDLVTAKPGCQANMDTMVADLTKVMNASASGTGKLKFSSFLPTSIKTLEYFTYDGSLTTPPCSQAVKWTVLAETQPVNDKQLAIFRKILNSDGEAMCNNFRPVQKVGTRKVTNNLRSLKP